MVLDTKVLGRKEMEKVFLLVIVLERKGHFQVFSRTFCEQGQ